MLSNRDAAAQVAAEAPAQDGQWAWPRQSLIGYARRSGWPLEAYTITVTQPDTVDPRTGWHRPERVQDVPATCVPRTWLRRFAELTGRTWSDVCRGEIAE